RLGKINTEPTERDGRSFHGIKVNKNQLSSDHQSSPQSQMINYNQSSNQSSINDNQQVFLNHQKIVSESSEIIKEFQSVIQQKDLIIKEMTETIKNLEVRLARMEGEFKRLDDVERLIKTQEETISAQKMATEALNNERISFNTVLQKYREKETETSTSGDKPWYRFW
ncbi:MAG: hypothetical protein K2X66_13995, partial [Cyanobacteria bacterium]|nr:hypothetical protein [Cyanobacteriota bacterium]